MIKVERGRPMFALYAVVFMGLGLMIAWFTWPPLIRFLSGRPTGDEDKNNLLSDNSMPVDMEPGFIYIEAVEFNKIIVWTTVNLIYPDGNSKPLPGLTKENFKVVENYDGASHEAIILDVIPEAKPSIRSIILIDISGSMNEPSGIEPQKKLETAKMAASSLVDQILSVSEQSQVAVLRVFGNQATHANFIKDTGGKIWWGRDNKDELKGQIYGLQIQGNTPLWGSIQVALDAIREWNNEKDTYKFIICISDGKQYPKGRDEDLHNLLKNVQVSQIPIVTFGYGVRDKSGIDEKTLAQISAESGAGKEQVGSFMRAQPDDWDRPIRHIKNSLANLYQIYWVPTASTPGTEVMVIINIKYKVADRQYEKTTSRSYTFLQSSSN